MGYGDSLIVTSIVKRAALRTKRPIVVGDGNTIKWCPVFDHNPKIAKKITPDCVWVREVKGNRPYIDYTKTTREKMAWKPFYVEPGEIYLTPKETNWIERGFVYIEPNCKRSNGNKDWGFDNWQKVVNALPGIRFIQGAGRKLRGVHQENTLSFRDACGLLSHADLFVGTDGGLHHAAAALGKRAVVVWGGFIGPDILGYKAHTNLWAGVKACGNVLPCPHCRDALAKITPEMVIEAIRNNL